MKKIFNKFNRSKIKNREILDQICQELKITLDYDHLIHHIIESISFYTFFLTKKKISKIYINCYYDITKLSAIYVAKKLKIPVIELQHGLINKEHFAYISYKKINNSPYPDYLFCYGEHFKKYISPVIYSTEKIYIVGSCYIDLIKKRKEKNTILFQSKHKKYNDKKIITVASQIDIDEKMLLFITEIADISDNIIFIYVPRMLTTVHKKFYHKNIIIESELDVYQCMQNSDITTTVGSTCAVESLVFGTPVILLNIDNLATTYYSDFFSKTNYVTFVNTKEEFIQQVNTIETNRTLVENQGNLFFAENHQELLKKALNKLKEE